MSDSNTLSITQMSSVQLEISAKMKTETGVSLGWAMLLVEDSMFSAENGLRLTLSQVHRKNSCCIKPRYSENLNV